MSTQKTRNATVNSVELTDMDAVAKAFSYLNENYNDGDMIHHYDESLTLISRYSGHMEHWNSLIDSEDIRVSNVSVVDGKVACEVRPA